MKATKPLDRDGYMKRVFMQSVELAGGAIVNIRVLPASIIVNGAQDASLFEPANLLVQSLVDEQGQRLFADGEKDHAMTIDHTSLRTVLDAIVTLNGLQSAKEDEGGAGDAEKN
jgi:hypothetical protein